MFFGWFDAIFSFIFPILFLLFIGMFFFALISNLRTWNKNNHSPRLTVPATVVAKRTEVSRHKHSVVRTIYFEFHAVAAFHLKGRIIGRERMRHRIVRMVVRNFRSLCHNRCRNSQPRRMVVFIPCADISDDGV